MDKIQAVAGNAFLQRIKAMFMQNNVKISRFKEAEIIPADQLVIEGNLDNLQSVEFELCVIPGGNRSEFAEDVPGEQRRLLVRNRKRPILFESLDEGNSWRKIDLGSVLDTPVIRVFTLKDGRHIIQAGEPLMTICLDSDWNVLFKQQASKYKWHGSCSIAESADGTVIFSEYRGTNSDETFVEPLSAWRLQPGKMEWEKVFSHDAHGKTPDGYIRHFHTCMSDPYIEGRWYLSSGDIGEQNKFWLSDDNGDSWKEIKAQVENPEECKLGEEMRVLRYTSAVITEEAIYWVTDDNLGTGSSAFVRMDKSRAEMPIKVLCRFEKNLMRSLTAIDSERFFCISESKDDTSCVDFFIISSEGDILASHKITNISEERCPVTLSIGSGLVLNNYAFFPALGRIFSERRDSILRIKVA